MSCKYANLTKEEIEKCILPFIPPNRWGFSSRFSMVYIIKSIVYKLKSGCQWKYLFIDIEGVRPPFSWQTVYYFYRKWCRHNEFQKLFNTFVEVQRDYLDTEKLNLDGTHSLVRKSAQSAAYQHRKRGRTSNILIMTDGNGIPIACGDIISGNHNDQYRIVRQYGYMIKQLNARGIYVENSIQNADKGFDSKALRRAIQRRKVLPNIKENRRNRKTKKRGSPRFYNDEVYKTRFVNERCFAWMDSFRTLFVRYDTLDKTWLNWHLLVFALILLKV